MQFSTVFTFVLLALPAVFAAPSPMPGMEDGLDSASRKLLRALNAKCYKECVDNCNSFYKMHGDEDLLQRCFNKNCVPMKKDGRCLRK